MITAQSSPNADTPERRLSEARRVNLLYMSNLLRKAPNDREIPGSLLEQAIEEHGEVCDMSIGSQPRALRKGYRFADGMVVEFQRHVVPGFSGAGDWERVRTYRARGR